MRDVHARRCVALVLCLAALVALAGCSAVLGPEGGDDPSPSASPTPTDAATVTSVPTTTHGSQPAAATPAPTATPTPAPVDSANPFGNRTLAVAIAPDDRTPERTAVVRRALDYWEGNAAEHAGYPVEFVLVDASASHRIELAFESAPVTCGTISTDRTIGCAPVNERRAPPVSQVTVAANQTDAYTHEILVHELGHVLGLGHDDEPRRYMRETLPSGLGRDTVDVYLTGPDDTAVGRARSEVETALSYFESHPSLAADERPTFEFVTTREAADFVIEIRDGGCFDDGGGSCTGEPAYRGQQQLVLDSLDTEVVAWHVAYHLAPVYLADVPEDLSGDASRSERTYWDG